MNTSEPDQLGDFRIPDHTLLRCIGRGSSGKVWLSRSAVTGGYHAVKIIRRANFTEEAPFLRELKGIRKFEPISRSHPGFVNILHVGQDEAQGCFYYTMELADGVLSDTAPDSDQYQVKTIEQLIREGRRLSVDEVLELGLRLSDALHHLHEAGLVHRDIKPSNILFVAGRPKLADIGLVTEEEDAHSLVGTPGYIPPEGPGSRQADVFALGKVLYECLTGLDRSRFPDLPTFFDGHPDQQGFLELNEIILKACHQDFRQRYQTARQLHADLTAVENGESVIRLRELELKLSRLKGFARVGAIALLALGLAGFVVQRELRSRDQERQRTVGTLTSGSVRALRDGDYAGALRDTARVISLLRSEKSEQIHRLRYGTILSQMPTLTLLQALDAEVRWCEFTPDAAAVLIGLADGRCQIRNASSGQVMAEFIGHSNSVHAAVISPDGQLCATACEDGAVRLWDRSGDRLLRVMPHGEAVAGLAFHPSGNWLATACADGWLRVWEAASGKLLHAIKAHSKELEAVRFSHSGELLASGGRDNIARLWKADNGEAIGEPIKHGNWVVNVAFSPDDQRLMTACADHAAYVWSVESRSLMLAPLRHERGVRRAEFSPDGSAIMTAGWDGVVCIWDSLTGELEPPLLQHGSPLVAASFSASGNRLVTGCTDGTLRIWDRAGRKSARRLVAHSISSDGGSFLRRHENTVEVFSMASPQEPRVRINTVAPIKDAFLSDTGSLLGTVETNQSCHLRIWSAAGGQPRSPSIPLASPSVRCRFDAIDARIAVIENNSLSLYGVSSGQRAIPPLIKSERIHSISFSPDGSKLAVVSSDGVDVREVATGHLVFPPLTHQFKVRTAVFSPDSKHLAICTTDSAVGSSCYAQVWDLTTGQPVGGKLWHRDGVQAAAWSGNGQHLITVSEDGVGRIWSIPSGELVGKEIRHRAQTSHIALRSEPELALTASLDLTARLWDGKDGEPISPAYRFPDGLKRVWFCPDSTRFVAQESGGPTWMQEINSAQSPQPLLQALADVLAGRSPLYGQADEFKGAKGLAARWEELRSVHPEWFSVSSDELLAWRRCQVERFHAAKHRRFELFHLNEILRLSPANTNALQRKKRLEEILETENGKTR